MNKETLEKIIKDFVVNNDGNYISPEKALSPDCDGLCIHGEPIIGFASAEDKYLLSLVNNEAANTDIKIPKEWLPSAKSIISIFFPYTEEVKATNRGGDWPSNQWLHARIEGQELANDTADYICEMLAKEGYEAMAPTMDPSFAMVKTFSSNWSERHVAYAAGLGTFSLSKGLITEKGVAGRYMSIITSMEIEPTNRPYTELTEYCSLCGKCIKNCPVDTISLEEGKVHKPCAVFLNETKEKHRPYYGCGKCQCDVPCESGIPKK